ncbi:MAG: HEAT repeat domain-containing protein, partial [Cyanobacteria bacterium P01_A01_bin.80]
QAIAGLLKLMADSQDESTRWRAAESLGKIDAGNEQAITGLLNLMADSQDEDTRWRAAESLGKIGAGNEQAIAGLVNLMADSQDESTRRRAAESLGKIGAGNEQAIAGLLNLMADSQDESTRWRAAESLGKIITVDYMSFIIAELKNHSQLNSDAYKLIWNCAQVLSYHDFYRAWNGKGERGRGSEGVRGGNWMGILTTTNY